MSLKKSAWKAISWRVIATVTTMVLVFMLTGGWELMLGVGFIDVSLKLGLYYLHERAWERAKYESRTLPLYYRCIFGVRPALLIPSTFPKTDIESTDECRAEWGVNDKVGYPSLGTPAVWPNSSLAKI